MTMTEQYVHLVDALMTAFDDAIDEIPGEEFSGGAASAAIACLLNSVAQSSDDPGRFLRRFCTRLLRARELQAVEQREEETHD